MTLRNADKDRSDGYWLGYLSTLYAHISNGLPTPARKAALKHLEPFLESDAATPELVKAIRERTPK